MKLPKLLFVLFVALFALPVGAVEYGGVGGRPANPQPGNSRSESIFIHTMNPGSEKEDAVRVINNTGERKTLLVYAVDSAVASGGNFTCAQAVEAKADVGAWIELSKQEVTLESMTNEVVPFKIKMPATAGVGEHNGCVVVQEKKDPVAQGGNGVQLSFRTAMRVAVLAPGQIERKVEIDSFKMTEKDSGAYFLVPSVKNLGNVSIDTDLKVYTKYFFGKPLQENGGQYPILRGQTATLNFELKKPFWGGWYKTSLVASYDASTDAIIGKDTNNPPAVLKSQEIVFFVMPQPKALMIESGILLAVIGLLVWTIFHFKRRSKKGKNN